MDANWEHLIRQIDRKGCVFVDASGALGTHTIGLEYRSQHPELLMLGLAGKQAHALLRSLALTSSPHERWPENKPFRPPFALKQVMLVRVNRTEAEAYMDLAVRFYDARQRPFEVLQVLWADAHQRYPGDPGCSDEFKRLQPRLDRRR